MKFHNLTLHNLIHCQPSNETRARNCWPYRLQNNFNIITDILMPPGKYNTWPYCQQLDGGATPHWETRNRTWILVIPYGYKWSIQNDVNILQIHLLFFLINEGKDYMEASEPKWVNLVLNINGVNSLRLKGLQIIHAFMYLSKYLNFFIFRRI